MTAPTPAANGGRRGVCRASGADSGITAYTRWATRRAVFGAIVLSTSAANL